jgi:hypothetical protein
MFLDAPVADYMAANSHLRMAKRKRPRRLADRDRLPARLVLEAQMEEEAGNPA